MSVYIHVCKYMSMGKHFVEAFMHMRVCTCLYVSMCIHLHMFLFVCINIYTNAHIYLGVWGECVCNGINAFIHKYLEAYMNVVSICNVM